MSRATEAMRRANLKHGHAQVGKATPEYRAWRGMINRCTNKNDAAFKNYGGRGIGISVRWHRSFEHFIADVGLRPTPHHSIDRIDNNGSYVKDNVRWATKKEQSRNRRRRPLTIDGVTKLLCEWAEESGIPVRLIWQRIYVLGWLPAKAVYYPQRSRWQALGLCKVRGRKHA